MLFSNVIALAFLIFMAAIAVILAFLTSVVSENLSYIASIQRELLKKLTKDNENSESEDKDE